MFFLKEGHCQQAHSPKMQLKHSTFIKINILLPQETFRRHKQIMRYEKSNLIFLDILCSYDSSIVVGVGDDVELWKGGSLGFQAVF